MEYRAKLAELSLTDSSNSFFKKLKLEAINDKHKPHSFAAYTILKSLGAKKVTTCLENIYLVVSK